MTDINVFINSILYMQDISRSYLFSLYDKMYKSIASRFFKKSAVAFCFRIRLSDNYITQLQGSPNTMKGLVEKFSHFSAKKENYDSHQTISKSKGQISVVPVLNIKKLKSFLEQLNEYKFEIDLLFVKRTESSRDAYSGNVAFPGGKCEKEDCNDLQTAIRETWEEIGIDFLSNDSILFSYLGQNPNFSLTMDFRYYVSSHVFILYDLFKKYDLNFTLSKDEISDAFFIPLSFFLKLNPNNQMNFVKAVDYHFFGQQTKVSKLMLNNNERYLVFGLTLRKFMSLMNMKETYINYREEVEFTRNKRIFYLCYRIGNCLFGFVTSPYRTYLLLKRVILCVFLWYIYQKFC